MMKKTLALILTLAALILCGIGLASADNNTGWVFNDPYIFYSDNGAYVKNKTRTIDGVQYKFDENGHLIGQNKLISIDGNKYLLGSDNKIQKGWHIIGDYMYYFLNDGVMNNSSPLVFICQLFPGCFICLCGKGFPA